MPLSVKDGMGAWVDDFKKSDAPQFKGKSEKERREMAIAAYMSAKRGNKNEATDNPPFTPDPPKPKAKNSDGSTTSPMSRARQLARQARDRSKEKDEGYVSHAQRKAVWANRADGGKGHPDKKKNESVEENYNWKVSHGGKDVHVKAPHAGAAVKKAQKGFGNMDLTKAKVSNLGKVGAPTTEATVDTANIASRKAMKQSDTEKLGKLADMLAKERKPQKEEVELDEAQKLFMFKTKAEADKKAKEVRGKVVPLTKQNFAVVVESVEQIDEVGRMSPKVGKASYTAPAKELKAYAQKSGGIDKKDFMQVADMLEKLDRINILQAGQLLGQLNAKLKNMDTSPREKVLSVLHSHGHNVGNVMPGAKMRRESVQLDELSPATHDRYQKAAFRSGAAGMAAKRMGTMSAKDAYDNEKRRHAGIELSKSLQRRDDRKKRNAGEVEEERQDTAHHIAKTLRKMGVSHDAKEHEILPKIPHALKKHGLHNNKLIKRDRDFQGNVIDSLRGMKESVQENVGAPQTAAHRRAMMVGVNRSKRMRDNEKARQALKDPSHNPAWANSKSKTEDTNEAKSFDQKFKDHLKFATSKSPAVQAYMKKRAADRDAMNKKNDPNAAKKGYALSAVPPERKNIKLRKHKQKQQ